MNLVKGQKVILRANTEEGWLEEEAIVEGVTPMPWGNSIMVRVKPVNNFDDGLREVTEEQIKEVT